MDSTFPNFTSVNQLKKCQANYNHYNIFHILERKRILKAKTEDISAAEKKTSEDEVSEVDNEKECELDRSTVAYRMYHSLDLPPLPPRYQQLGLPSHWFIHVVHNQKKRRVHRKSHGLIPFRELAQLVADNHKSLDYETRAWCQDVASRLSDHNKKMHDHVLTKSQPLKTESPLASTSSSRPKEADSPETTEPSPRRTLVAQINGPTEHRHQVSSSHKDLRVLKAYKMEMERRHFELANMMRADRSMPSAYEYDQNGRHALSAFDDRGIVRDGMLSQRLSQRLSLCPSSSHISHAANLHFNGQDGIGRSFPSSMQTPLARAATSSINKDISESEASKEGYSSKKPESKTNESSRLGCAKKDSSLSFITLLYDMIEDSETDDIIHWLPCGTVFNISDKYRFTKQLIPKFQDDIQGKTNNDKFKSFKKYLKQWDFARVTSGPENGAYKKDGFVKSRTNTALKDKCAISDSRDDRSREINLMDSRVAAYFAAQNAASRNYRSLSHHELNILPPASQRPFATLPAPAQLMGHQGSLSRHCGSLPSSMNTHPSHRMHAQAGLGLRREALEAHALLLRHYQGLYASSPLGESVATRRYPPYEPSTARRFSLPPASGNGNSYVRSEFGLSFDQIMDAWKDAEHQEEESRKRMRR